MRATIEEHCAKVMAVREYIKMIKDIVELPIQYPDEQSAKELQKFLSMPQKRSYDYSLIIITLYGVFESFIERIVCAYLSALKQQIKIYSQLPESIRNSHTSLSTKLMETKPLRYGEVKDSVIIANLNSCLNQKENEYQLNLNAFRQHSSNFRTNAIRDFSKTVGIENIDQVIAKDPDLTRFIQSFMGEADITPELPISKYFEIIEDLVERRNVVAHGSDVDELLSLDILDGYAEYIFLLMRAVYNSSVQEYYSVMISAGIAKNMGKAIQVYDNRIVCLHSANSSIKVGQVLIGKNNKGRLHWGLIKSIQVNGNNVDEVPSEQAVDIGMMVSFHAKRTYTYYLYSHNCP